MSDDVDNPDARSGAVKRIKARRDFIQHLAAFVVINTALIVVWATTGQGYFWPAWVLGGWGIGLVLNAWAVFFTRPITDEDIRRELDRRSHA
jgi:hypothetical protein